ncbi:MAG: hypothetical protein ACRCV9_17050 [Burkholderiaceae bacterium]
MTPAGGGVGLTVAVGEGEAVGVGTGVAPPPGEGDAVGAGDAVGPAVGDGAGDAVGAVPVGGAFVPESSEPLPPHPAMSTARMIAAARE